MNRRKYLKSVVAIIGASAGAYSLSNWLHLSHALRTDEIWKKSSLLEELVEVIIPTTDTPGAKSALVHEYIINVILYCTEIKQQHKFYSGLKDVERYSYQEFGRTYLSCTCQEKQLVVKYFATKDYSYHPMVSKIRKKLFGESFYTKLRHLTVEGYCQSRIGATQALKYDLIPGKFLSHVPVTLNEKSWATK